MKFQLLVLVCLFLFCNGQTLDKTLRLNAFGESVVDAVIEKIRSTCVLIEDKYLMRRIAAVETDFGKTAVSGTGGIWKVTSAMLTSVKSSCSVSYRNICNRILQMLFFDLSTATMSQMDIPLFSGLAMHAYIDHLQRTIPASPSNQAMFWKNYIRSGGDKSNFVAKSSIKVGCSAVKMELVFAIDASGSVRSYNFQKTLDFLEKVVKKLKIAPDMTRVAVIRYAYSPSISFNLDTHSSTSTMIAAIQKIAYTGGSTGTAQAIKMAQNSVFNNARQNVPKVFVLITDGYSNRMIDTVRAAINLKNDSTTIFTIGIGNINRYEMLAVASSPNCMHFYSLSSYNEIDAIISEIQRDACQAHTEVSGTSAGSNNETSIDEIPIPSTNETKTQNIIFKPESKKSNQNSTENTTIVKVDVVCGIVTIFASMTFSKPSAAYHNFKAIASDDLPGWIRAPKVKKLFLSLVSQKRFDLSSSACSKPHYNISFDPPDDEVTVICREKGVERKCTLGDINQSFGSVCSNDNVPNPCTKENIKNNKMRFKHPKSSTKYIQCKLSGQMEIVTCPTGTQYSELQAVCGPQITNLPQNSTLYTGPNPCTKTAIMKKQFYFANPSNKSSFIQCNEWGTAYLVNCPRKTVWSQQAYTCVHNSQAIVPAVNPCNSSSKNNLLYHRNPADRKSFIQCDLSGNAFITKCPSGTVWSQANLVCVHDSIKLGLIASGQSTSLPIVTTKATPCTNGEFFPHKDKTKYYRCVWGSLVEQPCGADTVWSQVLLTCISGNGSS